jgi:hypothetical protein
VVLVLTGNLKEDGMILAIQLDNVSTTIAIARLN